MLEYREGVMLLYSKAAAKNIFLFRDDLYIYMKINKIVRTFEFVQARRPGALAKWFPASPHKLMLRIRKKYPTSYAVSCIFELAY